MANRQSSWFHVERLASVASKLDKKGIEEMARGTRFSRCTLCDLGKKLTELRCAACVYQLAGITVGSCDQTRSRFHSRSSCGTLSSGMGRNWEIRHNRNRVSRFNADAAPVGPWLECRSFSVCPCKLLGRSVKTCRNMQSRRSCRSQSGSRRVAGASSFCARRRLWTAFRDRES
jgi:hypothetical protein